MEEIVQEFSPRLFNLAMRMTGDRETAEEIVQDAFMIVHRKLPEFRGESSLSTWIWRITANLCLKANSRLNAERVRGADIELEGLLESGRIPQSGELSAWEADPEKALFYTELVAKVRRECHYFILGLLTPEQRIVFLLRSHLELGFAEIGSILGIDENVAKSRMARARKRLEEDLRTRCSRHSTEGFCNCDDCARYLVHKHPHVLDEIHGSSSFADEMAGAFREAGNLEDLYRRFPGLEWRIPESMKDRIKKS